jgi:hypothetical protein
VPPTGADVATSGAVTFAKNTSGLPTDRIAKTIDAAIISKTLVLRISDEMTAMSQAFLIPGCSGSSAGSARKRGIRSFVAMGNASR